MPLDRTSTGSFAVRLLLPIGAFVLLLSLAANAFFIASRGDGSPAQGRSSSAQSEFAPVVLQPVAFGHVYRPIAAHPRTVDASGAALPGIASYATSTGLTLVQDLPLYRDQGIPFDLSAFGPFFLSAGIPIDPIKYQLLPDSYAFKSADGTLRVSFSTQTRVLTVVRTDPSEPLASVSHADDSEAIALATTFVQSLGVDPSVYGSANVVDKDGKTFVNWTLNISSVPVVDLSGDPVPAISVQVGRVSHRALNASFTLITPYQAVSSLYPTVSVDALRQSLSSGGLLPLPHDPKGPTVKYSSVSLVYLLLPQDGSYPTYLAPAARAIVSLPDGCQHDCRNYATLLPVLDPKNFDWMMK